MPDVRRIIGFASVGVFAVLMSAAAFAQSPVSPNAPQAGLPAAPPAAPLEYDLESLGEDLSSHDASELCAEFTPELQKLAGCGEESTSDPSLDEINNQGLEGVANDGSSPFGGVDPTQDVMNGLPGGGGGGGFDAFGGAIDDLTGGLIPGDL